MLYKIGEWQEAFEYVYSNIKVLGYIVDSKSMEEYNNKVCIHVNKLNKKLLEEVGTERTIGKPKNLIQEKIKELELQKINIEKNEEEIKYIEKEKLQLKTDIEKEENKNNLLKQIKTHKEQEKIEQEKIKTNEQLKQELLEIQNELAELNKEISELEELSFSISKDKVALKEKYDTKNQNSSRYFHPSLPLLYL